MTTNFYIIAGVILSLSSVYSLVQALGATIQYGSYFCSFVQALGATIQYGSYFCSFVQALGATIQYGSPLYFFCPLVQALGATIQYGSPLYLFLPTCADSGCYYSVWVSFIFIFAHLRRLWVLLFSFIFIFQALSTTI